MILALAWAALHVQDTAAHPLSFARSFLRKGHHFIVCAHRGDHTQAPENTLDAIRETAKDDVDFVELDLRLSKDGTIVLMHDGAVNRTTDGTGKVEDLTLEQLRTLNIKGARHSGERVPTFEEALDAAKGKLKIYMDIKAVTPAQVLPLLKKHRMERDVIAYVYSDAQRQQWRTDAPAIPLISELDKMESVEGIETTWKSSPFAISDGNALGYKLTYVAKLHALGVAVVPDIQNPLENPNQWLPMIQMGVDGLQTDHPGALVKWLKEMKLR